MSLAKYSLDNTKIIYFFLAVLLIGGITSFGKLGKKEDAPFVIKSAVIMTRYPGAEPAEVERLITEPISREIQSISGTIVQLSCTNGPTSAVKRMLHVKPGFTAYRSRSNDGSSIVMLTGIPVPSVEISRYSSSFA